MRNDYTQTKHKILYIWNGILKLIAIEEEILERLERAESAINRISLTISTIEKRQ